MKMNRKPAGFLDGKRILIVGALSSSSLAYGVAKACFREGAHLAMTYQKESLAPRVLKLAKQFDSELCFPCDVASDAEIVRTVEDLSRDWATLDGIVHAVGFAPPEAISGDFLAGASREGFRIAHDISSYSFIALIKAALPLMKDSVGSILTLSYIGANRIMPAYNTMGLAKASLEAAVRYAAASLGPLNVRVNALSSAPVRTIAASGLGEIERILAQQVARAPLRRPIGIDEVGNAGAFLLSDLSSGITGQIVYVDGGFSIS